MAIDKNIAALLDENAYTVRVVYPVRRNAESSSTPSVKSYCFVSNIQPKLQPGDSVLVGGLDQYPEVNYNVTAVRHAEAATLQQLHEKSLNDIFKLPANTSFIQTFDAVLVVEVDAEVAIEPDAKHTYRWVVGKIDTSGYDALLERNRKIAKRVADVYKNNMRNSFRQQILGGLPEGEQSELLKLLGN